MRVALIGQPNCGKSTLFNQVAGYKADTGNFPGTTVTYTESSVKVIGETIDLVDLPGTYSLTASNLAEKEVIRYLSSNHVDVILNLVDASHLVQGLELTLELLELGKPLVVGMNMMDEAARMGITIDGPHLQQILGVPVLPLIASKGRGIKPLFTTILDAGRNGKSVKRIPYKNQQVEEIILELSNNLQDLNTDWDREALAIRLLEDGSELLNDSEFEHLELRKDIDTFIQQVTEQQGKTPNWVFSEERHALAQDLTKQVMIRGEERVTWQTRADDILLHSFWGYVILLGILWAFFHSVYLAGSAIEGPLISLFDGMIANLNRFTGLGSLLTDILTGALQGIAGGVAIVLPYLLPFLLGMGFLEDIGYLPRLAFLMDSLMQRMGLHGKAIIPFILGYGCNVPAVMATRTLEERRDRFLAATLSIMVPCSARIAVIFGLVAFYLGSKIALLIYIFNIIVIALTGRILSWRILKESPGLILEIPPYRMPTLKTLLNKTWFRAKEFVIEAWPMLIVGSIFLELAIRYNFADILNLITRPFTWLLGLPSAVGVPLIFGVLRKELSMIMLRQALNVTDISQALNPEQMITFTIFVVFYIPCLATLAALRKELNTRDMLIIAALSVVIAMVTALVGRGLVIVLTPFGVLF
jgi:ferrous iron transport protein B